MKKRAGVVVYNLMEKSIVLMKRVKNGNIYWVIPGGGVEDNETELEAGIRETYEEIGIKITNASLIKKAFDFENHSYFLLELGYSPVLRIIGEEKSRETENDQYQLNWVEVNSLSELNIVPVELKTKLILYVNNIEKVKKI